MRGHFRETLRSFARIAKQDLKEAIAAWALQSYPKRGDAAFLVHSPNVMGQGVASMFWDNLRAHFIQRPFIMALGQAIADIKDEPVVTIESQDQAQKIFNENAEEFLRDMYKAHRNGAVSFGRVPNAVERWLKRRPIYLSLK